MTKNVLSRLFGDNVEQLIHRPQLHARERKNIQVIIYRHSSFDERIFICLHPFTQFVSVSQIILAYRQM